MIQMRSLNDQDSDKMAINYSPVGQCIYTLDNITKWLLNLKKHPSHLDPHAENYRLTVWLCRAIIERSPDVKKILHLLLWDVPKEEMGEWGIN